MSFRWACALVILSGCDPVDEGPFDDGGVDLAAGGVDMAGFPVATEAVVLFVQPEAGVRPILDAIKGAKTSIEVESYLFTDQTVADALIASAKAGRKVRVVMERSPTAGSNATMFSTLSAGGVVCLYGNPVFTFTHAKSMVIDQTVLWAMTANFTNAAVSQNREYLLADTDPADVAEAHAVFEADWARAMPSPTRLAVAPQNGRSKLVQLISSAQSTLDVEWEALSDNEIGSRIAQEVKAGIKVRIVVPTNIAGTATETMLRSLKATGAEVRTLGNPYIHAKMILVDRSWGFVGSENGTANSLDSNRELGVVWRNEAVAAKLGATFDADFAAGQQLF